MDRCTAVVDASRLLHATLFLNVLLIARVFSPHFFGNDHGLKMVHGELVISFQSSSDTAWWSRINFISIFICLAGRPPLSIPKVSIKIFTLPP